MSEVLIRPDTQVEASTVPVEPKTLLFSARAYSYIRMSTQEQLRGDSLRRQSEKAYRYARENSLDLIEDGYEDIGVSAFRGKNAEDGALRRFLDAVEDGDIPRGSYLLIESIDRLTRQAATVAFALLGQIVGKGIVVVTLDDGQKYTETSWVTNQGQLFVALGTMVRAHDESRQKSLRLAAAWQEKRRKLREDGLIHTSISPAWLRLNKERGAFEIIPARAKVVREIFELACSGYGIYSIARTLNLRGEAAWGVAKKNRARKQSSVAMSIWRETYIKKILTNRAVLGEFQPHRMLTDPATNRRVRVPDGEPLLEHYPKIIELHQFNEAALAMERRRTGAKGRKGATYANLLSGMLFCAKCGASIRYIDKGDSEKGGRYYRCSRSFLGGSCDPHFYRYDLVERLVLSFLESLDVGKVLGGEKLSKRIASKAQEIELLRIDLEMNDVRSKKIVAVLLDDGGGAPHAVIEYLRGLEEEKAKLERGLLQLENEHQELLQINPQRRNEVIGSLLARIKDKSDREVQIKTRRALASELQRMIDTIKLRACERFPWEIIDEYPDWKRQFGVRSMKGLERYLVENGFELEIKYRSGDQQIIDPIKQSGITIKLSQDMRRLMQRAKYARSSD